MDHNYVDAGPNINLILPSETLSRVWLRAGFECGEQLRRDWMHLLQFPTQSLESFEVHKAIK